MDTAHVSERIDELKQLSTVDRMRCLHQALAEALGRFEEDAARSLVIQNLEARLRSRRLDFILALRTHPQLRQFPDVVGILEDHDLAYLRTRAPTASRPARRLTAEQYNLLEAIKLAKKLGVFDGHPERLEEAAELSLENDRRRLL